MSIGRRSVLGKRTSRAWCAIRSCLRLQPHRRKRIRHATERVDRDRDCAGERRRQDELRKLDARLPRAHRSARAGCAGTYLDAEGALKRAQALDRRGACSSPFSVSSTLDRTTSSTCPRSCSESTRIASFSPSAVSSAMVASVLCFVGAWQQLLNQIEATASKCAKNRLRRRVTP